MRKLTHEEFINKLKLVSPNLECLSNYNGMEENIEVRCKLDGYQWETTPHNLLKHNGCVLCLQQKLKNDFEEKLHNIFPNIQLISNYINTKTSIRCKCLIDGHEWNVLPCSLLDHKGNCPKCTGNIKRTQEDFINQVKEKHGNKFEVLSEYIGYDKKVTIKCNDCGDIFQISPSELFRKKKGNELFCANCSGRKRISDIDSVNEILENDNINIVCIKYSGNLIDISSFRCNVCGYEWDAAFNSLKNSKSRCPSCSNKKRIKTIDEVNNILAETNRDLVCIDYAGRVKGESIFYCNKCGRIWTTSFDKIKNDNNGCPYCNESKGELQICSILDNYNINYIRQYKFDNCRNKNPLPFDFAIFINNDLFCLIEYDGELHYKNIEKYNQLKITQKRDKIKTEYCNKNNIQLIRIPYWEFENIEYILKQAFLDNFKNAF